MADVNMREAWQWGKEVADMIRAKKEAECARQRITFGKNTVYIKKGEPINMMDFMK